MGLVAGVVGVFDHPVGPVPALLGVVVLRAWQLCPGDALWSFHHPLTVEGSATAIPSSEAANQDNATVHCGICEYPGVHSDLLCLQR